MFLRTGMLKPTVHCGGFRCNHFGFHLIGDLYHLSLGPEETTSLQEASCLSLCSFFGLSCLAPANSADNFSIRRTIFAGLSHAASHLTFEKVLYDRSTVCSFKMRLRSLRRGFLFAIFARCGHCLKRTISRTNFKTIFRNK